jgi:hypothetical protein
MPTDEFDPSHIRALLQDIEIKLVLDSPNKDYRFEYYTASIKDRQTDQPRLSRTYRLFDVVRGGIVSEPWDAYDLDKQTTLIAHLIKDAHYRITKVVRGWEVSCPECGHMIRGKIWQSVPKTCTESPTNKCRAAIDEKTANEVLYSGPHSEQ